MKTIWKYALRLADVQAISMPTGARILSLQTQSGLPCVWALVDPSAELEIRRFVTYGTGHEVVDHDSRLEFVGTYQTGSGVLVFHVFEVRQ